MKKTARILGIAVLLPMIMGLSCRKNFHCNATLYYQIGPSSSKTYDTKAKEAAEAQTECETEVRLTSEPRPLIVQCNCGGGGGGLPTSP